MEIRFREKGGKRTKRIRRKKEENWRDNGYTWLAKRCQKFESRPVKKLDWIRERDVEEPMEIWRGIRERNGTIEVCFKQRKKFGVDTPQWGWKNIKGISRESWKGQGQNASLSYPQ